MSTATPLQPLSPNAVAAAAQEQQTFLSRLALLPLSRKLMLAGGIVALVAIALAMTSWSRDASYKVLFAGLSDKDGGAILAQLSTMNVPYKHAEGGSAILVPADKVHDVRLKLAQIGLPKGSTVGFELMDNARFGTTQFQERLNFQRGLEGELVRSITALAAVQAARVHLALPNQNGFFREQQKPSASVLLTLHNGRTLDRSQIAGIVHLVSSSVPELNPKAVSVLDHTGTLLSGPSESMNETGGLDAQQLQYRSQLEANFTKRILDILEPIVGRDNLRAQVTAEVDFTQTESTSEEYKPNQGDEPAAVRSAQVSDATQAGSNTPSGVPGAASNQPPTPATAPVTGSAAPLQGAQGGAGGTGPARIADQLRGGQDRARDPRVTRHHQAPECRGGGEPPHRDRCQGQARLRAAGRRGTGEADRAGAGERGLQQGARRLGQGDQRAVQGGEAGGGGPAFLEAARSAGHGAHLRPRGGTGLACDVHRVRGHPPGLEGGVGRAGGRAGQ